MAIRDRDFGLAPISYWNPSIMLQELERAFDDLRMGMGEMSLPSERSRLPALDIRDDGDHYTIEAELPGIKKDEVDIEVGDDALVIKAQKDDQVEEKKDGYVRRERGYMSFYRQIPLPDDVDRAKAGAKMEDGILSIILPKRAEQGSGKKKLDVQ